MFEQAVMASDAMRHTRLGSLIPALRGCRGCGTQRMVMSPQAVHCSGCGAELAILPRPTPRAEAAR
ncbi:hypothetical protein NK718_17410 [Alsobacter sp. SYSU M60028]|uniref:Uncharacterized protein n=1 Tax=Alsobacter ponti TaxID=2962936 RepID=A0ABT1LFN3_9HYPH|nr:hypothetical protein [Alsobacter ponti]MCP8940307.1 hypothetical protein [Alsobacter ponti]